jgi:hypothetical protein
LVGGVMIEDYIQVKDQHLIQTFGEVSMPEIIETLQQRHDRYGEFGSHAFVTQNIKAAMQRSNNWATLSVDKREALEMIAHKIGRILNGDPEYKDSWHDIIGYTKLVEQTLND